MAAQKGTIYGTGTDHHHPCLVQIKVSVCPAASCEQRPPDGARPVCPLSQCTYIAHVTLQSKRKIRSPPHQPAERALSGIQFHILSIVPPWALF